MMGKKIIELEELRQLQLSILIDVAEFCDANDIKYFLAYGTLLGAIRHKGYIPWDDDIDICMPRPDYDKFFEHYNHNESPFRAINFDLDNRFALPFGKVHDIRTVMDESLYKQDVYGVYIDVLPLDGCDEQGTAVKQTMRWRRCLNAKKAIIDGRRPWRKNVVIIMGKLALLGMSVSDIIEKILVIAEKTPYKEATYVCNLVDPTGVAEIYKKEDLESLTDGEFEGYRFKIPTNFDLYLHKMYGDYMQLPPVEKQITHHTFEAWWKS